MKDEIRSKIEETLLGKAPNGYRSTEIGIFPSDWKLKELQEIAEPITETAGSEQYETVSISAGIGFVNQAQRFGKELSGKQYEKYTVLHCGDFSYNKGNSNRYPQGCIYRLHDREQAAVPNVFESFRITEGSPEYYEYLFLSGFLNRQLARRINHGVRDDGLLNLTQKDFYSCKVPVPPLHEQQRIAEILSVCDQTIELYKQKTEQLQILKKYLLEKMFPQFDANTPEIRFSGFTDPWEQRKLKELANVKDSARISNAFWTDKGVPYIRASDLSNNSLSGVLFLSEETFENYKKQTGAPARGDLLFNGGGEIGKAVLKRDDKPLYVQGGAVLYIQTSLSTAIDGEYLETYFQCPSAKKYIDVASAGGTMKHFTLGPSQEMPIIYPSLAEQKKIGTLLSNLDKIIALHQRMFEMKQTEKNALIMLLLKGIVRG